MSKRMWTVEVCAPEGPACVRRWWPMTQGLRGYCQGWMDAQREGRRTVAWRLLDPRGRVVEELEPSPPASPPPLSARLDGGVVTVELEVGGRVAWGSAPASVHGLPDALSLAARRALDSAQEDEA